MGVLLTILLSTNVLVGVWILPTFISWVGPRIHHPATNGPRGRARALYRGRQRRRVGELSRRPP